MRDKFQRGFDVNRKPDKAVSGCPTQFLTFMAPVSNFFYGPTVGHALFRTAATISPHGGKSYVQY